MGRHSRPTHKLRNTLMVGSAIAASATTLFAAPASADPLDGCTAGARNPDIRVCQDDPDADQSNSIHALVKANPLLCVHAVILDGRRVVGTRDCSHHGVVPVVPVEPGPVGGTEPCTCTPTAPTTPGSSSSSSSSTVVTSPTTGGSASSSSSSETLPEAPAPQTVTNETAPGPLPAVTH